MQKPSGAECYPNRSRKALLAKDAVRAAHCDPHRKQEGEKRSAHWSWKTVPAEDAVRGGSKGKEGVRGGSTTSATGRKGNMLRFHIGCSPSLCPICSRSRMRCWKRRGKIACHSGRQRIRRIVQSSRSQCPQLALEAGYCVVMHLQRTAPFSNRM
mmetsp:Transcript_53513/g.143371  ORF Transcript_53513/g.143371 Transcript_53513/m.143371 type:complete len:155 (+) Transcript_53513:46-510(+)